MKFDSISALMPCGGGASGWDGASGGYRAREGLAIVLVVFGHLVARQDPLGVSWYESARVLIYLFHMPFFMYLSGYVAGLRPVPETFAGWGGLVRRRAVRLLLPFAAFGLLIVLAKLGLAGLVPVDNAPDGIGAGLRGLCAGHVQQPGGESPLCNLMEVKHE
ncbi:MAG TPA: acyltransferase family protein [Acidisphaera sp.]|nr:acyltransferase family protein [Acidisphaera sp.]